MNRIDRAFQTSTLPRLIPFIEVGDPDLETSLELIKVLEEEGACIIELGVPYADPLADGPVIQAASQRALAQGVGLRDVFQLAKRARSEGVEIPLVLFSYYNPIFRQGPNVLVQQAKESGIDGFIVPDLPLEESDELSRLVEKEGMYLIPLVAPTSKERIHRIVTQAKGFVYAVSSLGTTGVRQSFAQGIEEFLNTLRQMSPVPVAVGFGISNRRQVDHLSNYADAAVVGSALVQQIEKLGDSAKEEAWKDIRSFIRELKGSEKVST